jgi:hypothetical protein
LQGGKTGYPKSEVTFEVCPNGSFDKDMCRIDREIGGNNNLKLVSHVFLVWRRYILPKRIAPVTTTKNPTLNIRSTRFVVADEIMRV